MRIKCFVVVILSIGLPVGAVAAKGQLQQPKEEFSAVTANVADRDIAIGVAGRFNLARLPESRGLEKGTEIWIPRSERWQMHWTPTDLQDYMRQLDYFKIELAVATSGKQSMQYAFNVSEAKAGTKEGSRAAESRLCMRWKLKKGKVVDFDKEILDRAEIGTTDRMLLQFLPAIVEDQMAWMEKDNAEQEGNIRLQEYRMTTFGVRPKGNGYEIYVKKQEFREAPR